MHTNDLIKETSPYLLQHAHNPVNWNAWNEATLEKAKKENKLLLISIGYAACHWCHVMEKECFEDEEVAKVMNENFICIKVDREERPDVDQVYMAACQLINGNGGWPLNALAFPNGKPFFAGTYFPKPRWIQLLNYFIDQNKNNHTGLKEQSEHLSKGINDFDKVVFKGDAPDFSVQDLETIVENIMTQTDHQHGGLSGTVKFPMPSVWELLLKVHQLTGNKMIKDLTELTLTKIGGGGLYDHIGGGFARYATHINWHVPHFEKMLYDNAQLISLYSHAFLVTGNTMYKKIAYETIEFVDRELSSEDGFYSSIDADSEGEEGKFYVWDYPEIEEALGEKAKTFCELYGITSGGNWEPHKNILFRKGDPGALAEDELSEMKGILLQKRNERVRPATDDKIITSWNALMIISLLDAGRAFQDESYLKKARAHLDILLSNSLRENGELFRNFQKKKSSTHAFLDDYAFLIKALINCYEVSFEVSYLQKALQLADYVHKHFIDEINKMYFYNNSQYNSLITRPVETTDNVIPSSNAVMAGNLLKIGLLYHDDKKVQQSATMVKNMKHSVLSNPAYYSYWAGVMLHLIKPFFEIVIIGNNYPALLKEFHAHYLPGCIFSGSEGDENLPALENKSRDKKTLIYICQNKACQQPVESVSEALQILEKLTY